jgi:hypothetical protein
MSSGPDLATDPQIYRIIKSRGLTQVEAGAILGIKQPHVWPRCVTVPAVFNRTTIGFISSDRRADNIGCPTHRKTVDTCRRGDTIRRRELKEQMYYAVASCEVSNERLLRMAFSENRHPRMFLSGVQIRTRLDSRLKRAGMTTSD